jgi:hypothetical protein
MTIQKIIFISFALYSWSFQAQIWDYPHKIMGIEDETPRKKIEAYGVTVADSSGDGTQSYYEEFDQFGRKIKESYGEGDTTFTVYDEFNYKKFIVYNVTDTVFYKVNRDEQHQVSSLQITRKGKTTTTNYTRDNRGDVVEIHVDTNLYERIAYDDDHRIVKVEMYHHSHHGLSDIMHYRYEGDSIFYDRCPYDIKGNRYNWPCEETSGLVNEAGQVVGLKLSFHNANYGEYIPASSTMNLVYDKKGKILKISTRESSGLGSDTIYTRDKKGRLLKIETIDMSGKCYLKTVLTYRTF